MTTSQATKPYWTKPRVAHIYEVQQNTTWGTTYTVVTKNKDDYNNKQLMSNEEYEKFKGVLTTNGWKLIE